MVADGHSTAPLRNRLFRKGGRRRIALGCLAHRELLEDSSRKTCRSVDESVQGLVGECRRDQAEENDCPKHEANHGRVDLPNQRSS